MRSNFWGKRWGWATLTGAGAMLVAAGAGWSVQPATPVVPPARVSGPSMSISEIASRSVARVALVDLRALAAPTAQDHRVTLHLLRAAMRLAPEDQDILRLAIDAAMQAGDDEAMIELTRAVLKMDPADTVSQLRLITSQIARAQDVSSRLALYDNFLGPRGESIDPAIRSRLALDAALLCRENGNLDGFVDRLKQAVKLDATNKDAATLAYSFFAQRVDDAQARVETLIALMNADPTDAKFNESLAQEFASGGAHGASHRFYKINEKILELSGIRSNPETLAGRLTQQWMVEGAAGVLKDVNEQLARQRGQVERARKRAEDAGQPVRNIPEPSSIRLLMDVDQVRIAAASASGDLETETGALADLAAALAELKGAVADPSKRSPGKSEESLKTEVAFWERELLWMRLWTGKQTEEARKQFDELSKSQGLLDQEAIEAILALREGRGDEATPKLAALADRSVIAALGVGLAAEAKGDATGAAKVYGEVYRRAPGGLIGAWSRTKATVLSQKEPAAPESAARLEAMAAGIPAWMDDIATNPRRFEFLTVSVPTGELHAAAKALITVRLRNTSPIALALGSNRTMNSRLLLSPSVSASGVDLSEAAVPEVVNIDRRLRLLPKEEIVVTVWAEAGFGGWAIEQATAGMLRIRWRVDQGFSVDSSGATRSGGLSLSTETPGVVRYGLSGLGATVDELCTRIAADTGEAFAEALGVVRARAIGSSGASKFTVEETNAVCAALARRYTAEDAPGRMLVLCAVPTGRREPAMLAFDRAVRDIDEPNADVMMVKVVTRADEADSPVLAKASSSSNDQVKALAEILRQRLKAGARGFARLTSASLQPPAQR